MIKTIKKQFAYYSGPRATIESSTEEIDLALICIEKAAELYHQSHSNQEIYIGLRDFLSNTGRALAIPKIEKWTGVPEPEFVEVSQKIAPEFHFFPMAINSSDQNEMREAG